MEEDIYIPSPEELREAIVAFVLAICVVAFHRGREFGPQRFSFVAKQLGREFAERIKVVDAVVIMADFDEGSLSALGALYEEMVYIAAKYQRYAADAGINYVIPNGVHHFSDEVGNMFDEGTIKDITTVKGSVDKLMSKLPRWAQKILEVIMEALKLTRGG